MTKNKERKTRPKTESRFNEEVTFPFKNKNIDLDMLVEKLQEYLSTHYDEIKTKVLKSNSSAILAYRTSYFARYYYVIQVTINGIPNDFALKIAIYKKPRSTMINPFGRYAVVPEKNDQVNKIKILRGIENLVYSLENSNNMVNGIGKDDN